SAPARAHRMASRTAWRWSTAAAAEPSPGRAAGEWPASPAAAARSAQGLARGRRARGWGQAPARTTAHAAGEPTQDGQHQDETRETLKRRTLTRHRDRRLRSAVAPWRIAHRLSRHVGTPRPTRSRVTHCRWQISWLAGRRFRPPSQERTRPQWQNGQKLAAYSCGGSRGIERVSARTAFPFDL